jgi:hypothetical protein
MHPDPARRSRSRAIAALGLVALPVAGSAVVLPAVANAMSATRPVARADAVVLADRAAVVDAAALRGPAGTPARSAQDPTPVDDVPADEVPLDEVDDEVDDDEAAVVEVSPEDQAAVDAFLAAGYSVDDAVVLAELRGLDDSFAAKIEAGRYLVRGTALRDSPLADPTSDDGLSPEYLAQVAVSWGYAPEDVAVLAEAWGVDVAEAEVRAGRELKTVGVLPFVDLPSVDEAEFGATTAFFDAGYTYTDAEVLAQRWGLPDPYRAKVEAGGHLRDGVALAASPFADPSAAEGRTSEDLAAVFAAAGYTADDAVVLAAGWGVGVAEAQARGGSELATVGVLPFVDVAGV